MRQANDPLRRYADLTAERLRKGETEENWAALRDTISAHLEDYLQGRVERVDPEITVLLQTALRHVAAKELPGLFAPMRRRQGESANTAGVTECLRTAADYMAFCNAHAAEAWVDRAPRKTVATAFGTSDRNASRWKAYATEPPRAPWGITPEEHFAMLKEGLRAAARMYQRWGGAAAGAVRGRARGDI